MFVFDDEEYDTPDDISLPTTSTVHDDEYPSELRYRKEAKEEVKKLSDMEEFYNDYFVDYKNCKLLFFDLLFVVIIMELILYIFLYFISAKILIISFVVVVMSLVVVWKKIKTKIELCKVALLMSPSDCVTPF